MTAALAVLPLAPRFGPRMTESTKESLLAGFRRVMRPLVRILLRHGISFGEFAEVLKAVYVEVAGQDFALPAGRQSQSRIAIITGLTRKEVSRVVIALDRDVIADASNLNRVGRVLTGWHQDPDFTGPYGMPYELAFESVAGKRSFTDLVKRYSGDMPPRAMLDELKRVGAADETSGGQVRVLARSYLPSKTDPATLDFMALALTDLAETLDHNLDAMPNEKLFERRVWTPAGIPNEAIAEFRVLAGDRGQQFLELLDDWLSKRESAAINAKAKNKKQVGVAVYMFIRNETPNEQTADIERSKSSKSKQESR
jgi:hypothetical protein